MTSIIASEPQWSCVPANGKQINSCAITPDGSRLVCGTRIERGDDQAVFTVYCYDASGELLWSVPVSATPIQHGVYWVAIRDDGSCLVACYGSSMALFGRSVAISGFTQLDSFDVGGNADVQSVMVDKAGTQAVLASRTYAQDNATTGQLISFEIGARGFISHKVTAFDSGVMRVAITEDGSVWGASLHDGSCVCFQVSADSAPAWRYHPELDVELAYGFGISGSDTGTVHIALGANLGPTGKPGSGCHPAGAVFSMSSVGTNGRYAPKFNWVIRTTFGVNPGVSLDRAGAFVTATDGKPANTHKVDESAGHFYLFDNSAGSLLWSQKTKTMNWPMAISADGRAIVGGSDDGRLFYWAAG